MAEEKKIAIGHIGNALRSSAADHTTTFTDEVFDTERQKYQSGVNTDIEERIEALDLAINNEAQARSQNDQLLSQVIAAEQERAEVAEQENATAINASILKNEEQDQKLSELGLKISSFLSVNELPKYQGQINSGGSYSSTTSSTIHFMVVPINAGDTVTMRKNDSLNFQYAYLADFSGQPANGDTPQYAGGMTTFISASIINDEIVPEGAKYLYLLVDASEGNYLPEVFLINGINAYLDIKGQLNSMSKSVDEKLEEKTREITKQVNESLEKVDDIIGVDEQIPVTTKTGGYYSRSKEGVLSFVTSSDTYADAVDLENYIGYDVNIDMEMSATTTSTRITCLANSNDVSSAIIAEYKQEKDFYGGSSFVVKPTTENHWLYISYSNRVTKLSVSYKKDGRFQEIEKEIGTEEMGTTATTIKGAIAEVNAKSSSSIQPKDFPTLPYQIVKTQIGYALGQDIKSIKGISGFKQIYVNSVDGSDSANGETASTAYKTIKKALQTYIASTTPCCINIMDEDAIFYEDALNGETKVLKSLAIVARGRAKMISGFGNVSWTDNGDGTYSATLSAQAIGCLDMAESNKAKDGLYSPMTAVSSIDLCISTENSYYANGTTCYAHPKGSINTIVPLTNDYKVRWNHQSANTPSHFLYLENLDMIGTCYDACRSAAYPNETSIFEYFAINCSFQHNMRGDGIPINDYDVSYQVDCVGGYSKADIFNSHHTYSTATMINNCVIVTMNCRAREGGYYATSHGNNNLFTSHDGENVLRLNCNGINSDGPLFADVNGCRSFYEDCESWNIGYVDVAKAGSWQFNNVNARKQGFVTMINCNVYDRRNIPRIMSECDVEIRNTDVFTNCNITGNITTL